MTGKRYRILVVDDEPTIREAVMIYLSHLEYTVDGAENGVEALHVLTTDPYDLIILDLKMPHIDGKQVTEILRENKIHIPVLVMSAFEQPEPLFEEQDRIRKTFSLKLLGEKVERILKKTGGRRRPGARAGE